MITNDHYAMTTRYHCPHLSSPHPPLSPTYASSSSAFFPLTSLYFCEECDAVRCDQCVAIEVASYFCPNCLFDVPSANVRADKNRCARSCFACPQCSSSLAIVPSDPSGPAESSSSNEASNSTAQVGGAPYLLSCPGCRWSSREVGWEFEKPTGLALQLQKIHNAPEKIQSEFDALKDHLESYMTTSTPIQPPRSALSTRNPSRHISHLTQMASKALQRELPSMASGSARVGLSRGKGRGAGGIERDGQKIGWDEISDYKSKDDWKSLGLVRGLEEVQDMRDGSGGNFAALERRWADSWDGDKLAKTSLPRRIPLQPKLTKRCPHPTCRHLLIQPDTKSVRMKIKMVAVNYLPTVEIGRRRRRINSGGLDGITEEERDKRRKERRRTRAGKDEEDEVMSKGLQGGETYTFQLAFTNPLYDPIQIRLSQSPPSSPAYPHGLYIPTPHFTVSALKDAWAYDEEEEEDDGLAGDTEATGTSGDGQGEDGSLGRKSRHSILGSVTGAGSVRASKGRESGVEKKGNVSKVQVEVEVAPGSTGKVQFDLEVRYTYRADDPLPSPEGQHAGIAKDEKRAGGGDYKTFVFWIRMDVGQIEI